IEDKELRQMIDSISYYANQSRSLLVSLVPKDDAQRQALTGRHQNLEKFQSRVKTEREFVANYISTGQTSRQQLFGRN
ncbi:MAG TPA: hypothetical protein VNA26_07530, partial [Chitinophagaceae bacterium]|nr:hypothetical protein [Chitinophagaceae bacterium]